VGLQPRRQLFCLQSTRRAPGGLRRPTAVYLRLSWRRACGPTPCSLMSSRPNTRQFSARSNSGVPFQNCSRKVNSIRRIVVELAFMDVPCKLVIRPAVASSMFVSGSPNGAVFKALKFSQRIWT
jgi:hypothetical protein